jgi:hypothetical protein
MAKASSTWVRFGTETELPTVGSGGESHWEVASGGLMTIFYYWQLSGEPNLSVALTNLEIMWHWHSASAVQVASHEDNSESLKDIDYCSRCSQTRQQVAHNDR